MTSPYNVGIRMHKLSCHIRSRGHYRSRDLTITEWKREVIKPGLDSTNNYINMYSYIRVVFEFSTLNTVIAFRDR